MAKVKVGKGISEYTKNILKLYDMSQESIGKAVYQGAKIVAEAITSEIHALPPRTCSPKEKAGLLEGFGIAHMQIRNNFNNVKTGFDGYNSIVTQKFPKGQPNAMIARSICKGTSFRPKSDFVGRAVRKSESAAEEAMRAEFDKQLAALWPN